MIDRGAALQELSNPTTAPARLAEIAAQHPDLAAEVAAHPGAYDELLDWIASYGDARAQAAVAARRGAPAAPAAGASVDPFASAAPATADPFGRAPGAAVTVRAPRNAKGGKRLTLAIVLAIVGALVVGGGVTAALVLPRVLPAGSPVGAAEKFLTSVQGLDLLGLGASIAPSEVALLQDPLEDLQLEFDDEQQRTFQDALDRLRGAIRVTTEGLEVDSDDIAEGVERVTLVEGIITIDGDKEDLTEALFDLLSEPLRLNLESTGYYSDRELEDELEEFRDYLDHSLDLPVKIDAVEVLDDDPTGRGVAVVTVQESGGWYVSPMLTYADNSAYSVTGGKPTLEGSVPEPQTEDDPADAVNATLEAILDGSSRDYWKHLAATLPLAERRLVAIYGAAVAGNDNPMYDSPDIGVDAEFSDVDVQGDQAIVRDWDVDVSWSGDSNYGSASISGMCWDAEWEYESYDYYWGEYDWDSDRTSNCLEDFLSIDLGLDLDVGLDDVAFVAVRESGGWQLSPYATLTRVATPLSRLLTTLQVRLLEQVSTYHY